MWIIKQTVLLLWKNWRKYCVSYLFSCNNQFNFRTDWSDILVNHGFVYENRGFNEDPIRKNRRGEYSYTVTPPRFGRSSCTISGNETWRNHPHATVRPSNKASVPKVIFLQAAEFSKSKELQKEPLNYFLELKVKNSAILTFKVIFLCQKSTEFFSIFFRWKI